MSARRRPSLVAVAVLTVTWALLWERVSLFVVLTGVLLALLVFLVFPLPQIERTGRVRPVALARLVGHLAQNLVVSSIRVVALSFARHTPRSAIIRVRLRSRSDLILTMTTELVSLVPGSLVVEVRRAESTLYVHALDTVEEDGLRRATQDVLDSEELVLRAFGTDEDIAALNADKAGRPTGMRRR